MTTNDPDLNEQAKVGDRDAFDRISTPCRAIVARMCGRFFANSAEVDDAVQDAYLRSWEYRATFRGESSFCSWMARIASRVCIDILNRKRIHLSLDDERDRLYVDKHASHPSPEHIAIARSEIESVMALLSDRERVILWEYYGEKRTSEEISRRLPAEWNLSASGVRTIIHRKIKPTLERIRKERGPK